jgi:hypothetical protein
MRSGLVGGGGKLEDISGRTLPSDAAQTEWLAGPQGPNSNFEGKYGEHARLFAIKSCFWLPGSYGENSKGRLKYLPLLFYGLKPGLSLLVAAGLLFQLVVQVFVVSGLTFVVDHFVAGGVGVAAFVIGVFHQVHFANGAFAGLAAGASFAAHGANVGHLAGIGRISVHVRRGGRIVQVIAVAGAGVYLVYAGFVFRAEAAVASLQKQGTAEGRHQEYIFHSSREVLE